MLSEEERRFIILYRVCRLYKDGLLDDMGIIHFLAGYCEFIPEDRDFTKY